MSIVHVVVFDEIATPQKVLAVHARVNMGDWVDPDTKAPLRSDVLAYADLSAVEGIVPRKYWKHEAGAIVGMTAGEITAQDAAEVAAAAAASQAATDAIRASAAAGLDGFAEVPLLLRAFAKVLLSEINTLRAQHSLADRTVAQMKNAITNEVNSGDSDS